MDQSADYSWTQIQAISDRWMPQMMETGKESLDNSESVLVDSVVGTNHTGGREGTGRSTDMNSAQVHVGVASEPLSCDGGNVMQLSSSPTGRPCQTHGTSIEGKVLDLSSSCTFAEISRTGLEGLIGFKAAGDPPTKHLTFTADNFAVNLTVARGRLLDFHLWGSAKPTKTRIELRSDADTDSSRFCALMSACSNRTVARLIYRCQEHGSTWPVCSGYCRHMHFQVVVSYILGGSPARVTKLVDVCELTSKQPSTTRECDATKRVEVTGTDRWTSIRPSCAGTAC